MMRLRIAYRTSSDIECMFNFAMLRLASRALRQGRMRYARRRVGLVYDREEREVAVSELVDFWCCLVALGIIQLITRRKSQSRP